MHSTGQTVRQEFELRLAGGSARQFDFTLRPAVDAAGRVTAVVPEAVEITERRRAEAALREAQKLEAIGRLTGGIAHDFNNLLMVISGGIAIIERHPDPARRAKALQGMQRAVERGSALTRQMLTFGGRKSLTPRALDLPSLLGGMQQLLNRTLGGVVRVAMDFPPDLWPVHADAAELEMALLNLCVNARDAMPDGGIITLLARNGETPNDDAGPGAVRVSVVDTGAGMPAEVQARAFEPFFTTKDIGKGSGVGLAQVYGFAKDSGGSVEIDSAPGLGTTVSLLLPRSLELPEQGTSPLAVQAGTTALAQGTVLMVEDDEEVASLVEQMLQQLGYHAIRASSAAGALGALQNDRQVDVVFSDIMMPGGMNGVELGREIRRRRPHLPVVLTSGYADSYTRDVKAAGLQLLAKPYAIDQLAAALAQAVQGPAH
jgi:signal transduction histidine kinase